MQGDRAEWGLVWKCVHACEDVCCPFSFEGNQNVLHPDPTGNLSQWVRNLSVVWTLSFPTVCVLYVCMCVCVCVCACVTGRRDLNNSALQKRLDYLNNVTTVIVFITTGLNFFISTFGMQRTGHFPWLMMRIHWGADAQRRTSCILKNNIWHLISAIQTNCSQKSCCLTS